MGRSEGNEEWGDADGKNAATPSVYTTGSSGETETRTKDTSQPNRRGIRPGMLFPSVVVVSVAVLVFTLTQDEGETKHRKTTVLTDLGGEMM